jgi:carboxyl-terminal processing protease
MRIITSILIVLSLFFNYSPSKAQSYEDAYKYGQFLQMLERFYVDSINTGKIVEEAIINELKELDPHSTYISSEDVKKMNEPLQGNFEGVGISFNILKDTLFVITPIPGGPSEKVGILAGDRILKVDNENIAGVGLTNEDVYSLLRGQKGTKVKVSIKRRSVKNLLDFVITRDKIPINSLDAAYLIDGDIGYIKLNRFALTTMEEFVRAAVALKEEGIQSLILDLTGNAGGYLDVAAALSDQFLEDEQLIVYTEGLNSTRREFHASTKGLFKEGKLIILIDEGSASASEIVSGAVQDWDRGIIIGRRSFGKGLVQRQLELPDGSMIRLTTARYYTPSGRLIQKPYENGLEEYQKEIYSRYQNGEFISKDSIEFPDSLKYQTLTKQRIVFGGGGIMPDIFVPIDTSFYSDYFGDLIRKGILNQFVLEYVDKNRKKLIAEYPDFENYKDKFIIDQKFVTKLIEYASNEGLPVNQEELKLSEERISLTIKAYIARDLWSTSEFYEIINKENKNLKKAIEVMNNWDTYQNKILN